MDGFNRIVNLTRLSVLHFAIFFEPRARAGQEMIYMNTKQGNVNVYIVIRTG